MHERANIIYERMCISIPAGGTSFLPVTFIVPSEPFLKNAKLPAAAAAAAALPLALLGHSLLGMRLGELGGAVDFLRCEAFAS